MLTSNCVIVSLELCLDVGNDDYIILCHFGGGGGGGGGEALPYLAITGMRR